MWSVVVVFLQKKNKIKIKKDNKTNKCVSVSREAHTYRMELLLQLGGSGKKLELLLLVLAKRLGNANALDERRLLLFPTNNTTITFCVYWRCWRLLSPAATTATATVIKPGLQGTPLVFSRRGRRSCNSVVVVLAFGGGGWRVLHKVNWVNRRPTTAELEKW
jgi:hypothetical protein